MNWLIRGVFVSRCYVLLVDVSSRIVVNHAFLLEETTIAYWLSQYYVYEEYDFEYYIGICTADVKVTWCDQSCIIFRVNM
jgi:hypothetical protein